MFSTNLDQVPAKVRQSCSATDYYYYYNSNNARFNVSCFLTGLEWEGGGRVEHCVMVEVGCEEGGKFGPPVQPLLGG
jgi:hypothetical protein